MRVFKRENTLLMQFLYDQYVLYSDFALLEKQFNPDLLYNRIVHYYIDKKGYSKDKANRIAQLVVQKEAQRRICKKREM